MDPRLRTIRFWLYAAVLVAGVVLSQAWYMLAIAPMLFMPVFGTTSCVIYSDDYSSNTIASYDQRSGSWSIGSGVLTTSSTSAVLVCNTAADSGATGAHATVDIKNSTNGGACRLILGYVDDNNYWFAEVQGNTSTGVLKIFERSGGTNTQRGSTRTTAPGDWGAGSTGTLCFSIGDGLVTATFATLAGGGAVLDTSYAASPSMGSTKAGVATGSGASTCTFDNFSFNKHEVDDPTCSKCALPVCCGGGRDIDPVFNITALDGGTCTAIDGLPLTAFSPGANAFAYSAGLGNFSVSASCEPTNGPGITIFDGNVGNPCSFISSPGDIEILSCNPLHMVGTIVIGGFTYFVEVTE